MPRLWPGAGVFFRGAVLPGFGRRFRDGFRGLAGLIGRRLGLGLLGLIVPVAQADDADHLIIGEFLVKTRSPVSTFGSPFIEVTNPTAGDIDMGQVYITDATTSPSAFYYNIALMDPEASNPGGGNGGDFHAKFPTGFVLGAGQSLVISLNGSTEYFTAYGRQPDFELFEDGVTPDAIPDMREALPGAIGAKLVHPGRRVLAVCGDAGFMINVQEMETARRLDSQITVMVWEDGGYGLIAWKQDTEFKRHTDLAFGNPDWMALAAAFGWTGHVVHNSRDLEATLAAAIAESGPSLVAVPIDYRENPLLTERLGRITQPLERLGA